MKESFFYALASALITAGLLLAGPLEAQPAPSDAQTHVSYVRTADLDLSSKDGARAFEQRLAHAAREVCGAASDADLKGKNAVRACRDQAIAQATAQRDDMLAAARRGAAIAVVATR